MQMNTSVNHILAFSKPFNDNANVAYLYLMTFLITIIIMFECLNKFIEKSFFLCQDLENAAGTPETYCIEIGENDTPDVVRRMILQTCKLPNTDTIVLKVGL